MSDKPQQLRPECIRAFSEIEAGLKGLHNDSVDVKAWMKKMDGRLFGNGHDGIMVRLDRLEQTAVRLTIVEEETRNANRRVAYSILTALGAIAASEISFFVRR